jgi:hypothetical protein
MKYKKFNGTCLTIRLVPTHEIIKIPNGDVRQTISFQFHNYFGWLLHVPT